MVVVVEAVGMVTIGAVVGPKPRLLIMEVGVVFVLLMRRVEIGQLVCVQEGFTVGVCNGTDGGAHPGAGGPGGR